MKLNLEISNLSEVTKFQSTLVDINYIPFNHYWFPHKEEEIQASKEYIEENFLEEYNASFKDENISSLNIRNDCRILKVYDKEDTQDNSWLYYEYELYTIDNKSVVVKYEVELNHFCGTVHYNLYIENPFSL